MFIVLEIQTKDGVTAVLPAVLKETKNEAEQEWHRILSYAAVSDVDVHTAIILNERGNIIRAQYYDHTSEVVS